MNKTAGFFAAALLLIAACKKDNNIKESDQPELIYARHPIPNWYSGDTLIGIIVDEQGKPTGEHDTIFTKTVQDTSFIIHKGIQYYIWTVSFSQKNKPDDFLPNERIYMFVRCNTIFSYENAPVTGTNVDFASPHKYLENGQWKSQIQRIALRGETTVFKARWGEYNGIGQR